MKFITKENASYTIKLSEKELLIFHNALNEVMNGIDVEEFSTRMGAEESEVESLLKETHDLLK